MNYNFSFRNMGICSKNIFEIRRETSVLGSIIWNLSIYLFTKTIVTGESSLLPAVDSILLLNFANHVHYLYVLYESKISSFKFWIYFFKYYLRDCWRSFHAYRIPSYLSNKVCLFSQKLISPCSFKCNISRFKKYVRN